MNINFDDSCGDLGDLYVLCKINLTIVLYVSDPPY